MSLKTIPRPEEITRDFFALVDLHLRELMELKAEKRMGTGDLARKLFIAPRHLTNTIKQTTGKSPCDIMEEKITQEAQNYLQTTALSVSEIGARFGYRSPANFNKFFKGMAGITPLQYRKRTQAGKF